MNILFLHGTPGEPFHMEPLKDKIEELLHEQGLELNHWNPDLPNSDSLEDWSSNVANAINEWGTHERIVIVGHSFGGKVAIYAVYNDIGGMRDKVDTVITVNSPIRKYEGVYYNAYARSYRYPDFLISLFAKEIGCEKTDSLKDVFISDCTDEANWVANNKRWLSIVSGERYPNDKKCNWGNVDLFPRDMDDGLVPLSAQYTDQADTVYYGVYRHDALFENLSEGGGRDIITEIIVKYLLGEELEYSVLTCSGEYHHRADIWPGKDVWDDEVGQMGTKERSHYEVEILPCTTPLTGIESMEWKTPDPNDLRINIKSYAYSPWMFIKIRWRIYHKTML
jgi:pimeloyl-ACP methyl ester carboxylesterase